MPSKSPAQAKLMRAVAHGWKPDRMKGPPRKVAKEFVAADKKAKGMQYGGYLRGRREAKDTRTPEERMLDKYGTEPLTLNQAIKRIGSKQAAGSVRGGFGARAATAMRELTGAGWTKAGEGKSAKWYPPQKTIAAPPTEGGLAAATEPERTIQPIPGRDFIAGAAPVQRAVADIAPGFQPSRVPPSLLRYLEKARAGAGEEPVKMQFGGAMRGMMQRGRRGRRGFGGRRGQPQPPGGGGLARAAVMPGSAPGPGGGGSPIQGFIDRGGIQGRQLRRPGGGRGVGQGQLRPQPPGGGGSFRDAMMNRGVAGPQPRQQTQGPESFRRQGQPGAPPMKGIGRAPGAGVPLRGVGRPPGMGRPGAGGGVATPGGGVATPGGRGGASDYQNFLQQRNRQATAPGAGGGMYGPGGGQSNMPIRNPGSSQAEMRAYRAKRAAMGQGPGGGPGGVRPAVQPGGQFMNPFRPGGGGAGMPGGANRIGMGDQQGAQARALQVQTGRPPMSRRMGFPGRGGRRRGRFG